MIWWNPQDNNGKVKTGRSRYIPVDIAVPSSDIFNVVSFLKILYRIDSFHSDVKIARASSRLDSCQALQH